MLRCLSVPKKTSQPLYSPFALHHLEVHCLGGPWFWDMPEGKISKPIGSMYGIFTYIYHTNQTNVGKYTCTIHGWYGLSKFYMFIEANCQNQFHVVPLQKQKAFLKKHMHIHHILCIICSHMIVYCTKTWPKKIDILKLEVESPYIHSQKYVSNKNICPYESSFKSSWWLNQPIWKKYESKWFPLPQIRVNMIIHHLEL